jgi:hypothetical protein
MMFRLREHSRMKLLHTNSCLFNREKRANEKIQRKKELKEKNEGRERNDVARRKKIKCCTHRISSWFKNAFCTDGLSKVKLI